MVNRADGPAMAAPDIVDKDIDRLARPGEDPPAQPRAQPHRRCRKRRPARAPPDSLIVSTTGASRPAIAAVDDHMRAGLCQGLRNRPPQPPARRR